MKTKLLVLFTAILTLSSLSSCIEPYGYRRPYPRGGYGHHHGGTVGGYRGGGAGGGFGGSFGGFNR